MPLKIISVFFLLSFFTYSFIVRPINASENPKTILCYGNSLTAGYGLDPEFSYPSILDSIIRESGKKYQVINAGLSGETSAGGLGRIEWVLKNHVDIFILELGANDGLRGLPLYQTKQNLQAILKKVKNKYPDVTLVIAGMMVPPNMGPEYSSEFVKLFPNLATENNALLIPFLLEDVAGIPELNLSDGIHPNKQGQEIVAKNVFEILQPIL